VNGWIGSIEEKIRREGKGKTMVREQASEYIVEPTLL